jgi:hypothetical protein
MPKVKKVLKNIFDVGRRIMDAVKGASRNLCSAFEIN